MTSDRTRIRAPRGLSAASRRLFAQLAEEYGITDRGGREILRSGLIALDHAEEYERLIARDGAAVRDRWGQVKAHPLLSAARDFRAQWIAALRALNLAIGDVPEPGRPAEGE